MMAPALPQIKDKLDISSITILNMTLTIFLLAYALGPLMLGPLSEIYGRRWVRIFLLYNQHSELSISQVLHISNFVFLVFNLLCAFAPNSSSLIAFRFLGEALLLAYVTPTINL